MSRAALLPLSVVSPDALCRLRRCARRPMPVASSLALGLLAACGPKTDAPLDTAAAADAVDTATVDAMHEHLAGEFDSSQQALMDPSYYDVRLMGCPVDAPEIGDDVLYIEQALSTDTGSPYRQRLYSLEPMEADADGNPRARSVIWSFVDPDAFIGGCDDGGGWSVGADEVEIRVGCEVEMTWLGDHFEGGTIEDNCESDLYGASYATSEVALWEDRIESWDRGWYADGSFAWGAEHAGYVFRRVE